MGLSFRQKNNTQKIHVSYSGFLNIQTILLMVAKKNISFDEANKLFKEEFETKIKTLTNKPFYSVFSIHKENGTLSLNDLENFSADFDNYKQEIEKTVEIVTGVNYEKDIMFKPFFDFILDSHQKNTTISF